MITVMRCSICQARFHSFDADDDAMCLSCLEAAPVIPQPSLVDGVRQCAKKHYDKGCSWWSSLIVLPDEAVAELIGRARTLDGAVAAVWKKLVLPTKTQLGGEPMTVPSVGGVGGVDGVETTGPLSREFSVP